MRSRAALPWLLGVALLIGAGACVATANMIQNRPARETVFDNSGQPWPFFNQVAAINYDNGGQGFGYNVPTPDPADCPDGASYRPDAVNFKTSIAGAPAIPFQIGCGLIANSWNYTVNISQSGPYQITLQLAAASPGASWNILIDGVQVATVSTPNTGSYDTFAASTSGPFTATLGNHKLTLSGATGDTQFGDTGDILTWQGSKAPTTTINSVSMDCGNACGFTGGVAGTVGHAQAVMSSGSFAGTWGVRTSATDNFGATCKNWTGSIAISSGGTVTNGAIANGTYDGFCIVATQAGAGGSPFAQAVTITGFSSGGAPSSPTQAQVAGLTTCIICMDFTAASGGVWFNGSAVPGDNASNPSTWEDCAGAGSPLWYHRGLGVSSGFPCPDIVSDGLGHARTLRVTIPPQSPGNLQNGIALYNNSNGAGIKIPTNVYIEAVITTPNFPSGGYSNNFWQGGGGEIPDAIWNCFEFDAFEMNGTSSGGSSSNWSSKWSGGSPGSPCGVDSNLGSNWWEMYPPNTSGFDITAGYHTIGERITSDGSTAIYKCMWIDGAFQNCQSATVAGGSIASWQLGDTNSRMQLYLQGAGTWVNAGDVNGIASTMTSYYQTFNVWSCSSWQTTACHSSTADPGGY